ncbi:50S ribosomal protein L29 [[Mycoplasma] gypis]|uniref:Large ribosomal subunit protein uL29 n=1 Tax=[Mycoplasma] gypis TaxID=92404 RepID=A0ABZ2RPG8_9BACT|nr:50S ribosomal protein L29 [[Mycoplasma] gypis]MBN0919176.1 50S ribosomal protein L29 [[Mycoplasma] gypis]
MKYTEFSAKSIEELEKLVADYKANLFTLRFKSRTGQLDQSHKIQEVKKDIARALTALNEKKSKEVK